MGTGILLRYQPESGPIAGRYRGLQAGETPQDGVRELREELGIEPEPGKLAYAGVIGDSIVQPGIIDNEFCHVFFYRYDGAISASSCRKMRSIPSSGSKR
ncbi:hypothetical protein J6TS7_11480 [Paenibacillus dendritiformis]|nr:hypothetical protein J6TS7_11480 [Paenibacillus dendritiformis]